LPLVSHRDLPYLLLLDYIIRPGRQCGILMVIIMGMHITDTIITTIIVITVITVIIIITEDLCIITGMLTGQFESTKLKAQCLMLYDEISN
jgi:hypothetical protein